MCSLVNTEPQGLEGFVTTMATVFESMREAIWTRSQAKSCSGYFGKEMEGKGDLGNREGHSKPIAHAMQKIQL